MRTGITVSSRRSNHFRALLPAAGLALTVGCGAPGATPSPATCYDPRVVVGDTGTWMGTVDTTPDHVFHCGHTTSERPSYVFAWKPLSSGTAILTARGRQGEDTIMDVEDENCYTPLACNDDYMGVSSRVAMDVLAGHVYTVVIGTFTDVSRAADVYLAVSVTPGTSLDGGAYGDGGRDGSADATYPGYDSGYPNLPGYPGYDSGIAAYDVGYPGYDSGTDASVGPLDVGVTAPGACPGSPAFTCPPAITCSDGAGGAVSVPVSCGTAPSGARNICATGTLADGGTIDHGLSCLGAQMSCYGPGGAVWQCPMRWLATEASGFVSRVPNCCRWITTTAIPHGECGVAMTNGASLCDAPPVGMAPER